MLKRSDGPDGGNILARIRRNVPRMRARISAATVVLVFVVLDGVVHGREEVHRAESPLGAHAIVYVVGRRGHVHEQAGLVQLVDQLRERGQTGRVDVVHAGQVEYHALGLHHRLLAVVDRYGDGRQFAVVPGQQRVHLLLERVPVGHVQATGIVDDPDPGHLHRLPVSVHVHVQVRVRYPAQHDHGRAHSPAEHEQQRHDHAGQQAHVDLHQYHGQVRDDPDGRVRLGRFPHAHHVAHLQQYALQGHDRDAGQHAPGQRLEQMADPQHDGH